MAYCLVHLKAGEDDNRSGICEMILRATVTTNFHMNVRTWELGVLDGLICKMKSKRSPWERSLQWCPYIAKNQIQMNTLLQSTMGRQMELTMARDRAFASVRVYIRYTHLRQIEWQSMLPRNTYRRRWITRGRFRWTRTRFSRWLYGNKPKQKLVCSDAKLLMNEMKAVMIEVQTPRTWEEGALDGTLDGYEKRED